MNAFLISHIQSQIESLQDPTRMNIRRASESHENLERVYSILGIRRPLTVGSGASDIFTTLGILR